MMWKRFYMIGINFKKNQKKRGFSLIEVLVSVSLFVIIIMSATEIFKMVIEGQRDAIASQNVQESLKYFFEVIGKEMRMARRNDGSCVNVPIGQIFHVSNNGLGDVLYFKNFHEQCVAYQLATDNDTQRFRITRNVNTGFISPQKINIEALRFSLDSTGQPTVTVSIKAWAVGENRFKSEMEIQTSITSRYYLN